MLVSGRFHDQLRADPVDIRRTMQQAGTADAEPPQGGQDRAGILTGVAGDG